MFWSMLGLSAVFHGLVMIGMARNDFPAPLPAQEDKIVSTLKMIKIGTPTPANAADKLREKVAVEKLVEPLPEIPPVQETASNEKVQEDDERQESSTDTGNNEESPEGEAGENGAIEGLPEGGFEGNKARPSGLSRCVMPRRNPCHGEERSDEAIQTSTPSLDCFAPLAMTVLHVSSRGTEHTPQVYRVASCPNVAPVMARSEADANNPDEYPFAALAMTVLHVSFLPVSPHVKERTFTQRRSAVIPGYRPSGGFP